MKEKGEFEPRFSEPGWLCREELGGLPAGVLMSFVNFAEFSPGKTCEAPIVLQAHDGNAQEARKIFRKWNKHHISED